jgi:hypothetical protein
VSRAKELAGAGVVVLHALPFYWLTQPPATGVRKAHAGLWGAIVALAFAWLCLWFRAGTAVECAAAGALVGGVPSGATQAINWLAEHREKRRTPEAPAP